MDRRGSQPAGRAAAPDRRGDPAAGHAAAVGSASAGVTRFSFIVYGDTRGRQDGTAIQYEHSLVVDAMLARIKRLAATPYPVRFVLQTGDAVANGAIAREWNVELHTGRQSADDRRRRSVLPRAGQSRRHRRRDAGNARPAARAAPLPRGDGEPDPAPGSPRRLSGYPTYAFGYGNTFVIALDSDIAADETQYRWIKAQLDGLDPARFTNVVVFCHQPPFSSGPHGGVNVEPAAAELRSRYLPLFQQHHVRAVFSGHEHLFEHWVERYTDGGRPSHGPHRVGRRRCANLHVPWRARSARLPHANRAAHVRLHHIVRPGLEAGENPYHYVIVHVDGERCNLEVVGVDWGAGFRPYRTNKASLQDPR